MLRKLPDKISRFLIYLTAFGVSALMAIMLIHIIKESIPAFSELGIKMFLPSTEWRPVSANPQFGLLPAITGTLYVSFIAVVLALIFGVACACFLNFYLPEKIAAVFLAFIDLVAGAMMAFGRALGETMAVMMVIGNSPIFPKLLGRGQTLPSLTALEMGSIEYGSLHLSTLYVANVVLLVILLAVLGIGHLLKRRFAKHEF